MFLNGSLISTCLGCAFFFVESEGRSRCILYFKYREGTMNPRLPSENIESSYSMIILMRNFNEIVSYSYSSWPTNGNGREGRSRCKSRAYAVIKSYTSL